jgi:VIT1/CCC1 family predicted Fe2+/Mn2+ transporter
MSVRDSEMNRGPIRQREAHRSGRSKWLRAAVLGSDDAIVSTASLMNGVAANSATKQTILIAGGAGLVAGSMSMASASTYRLARSETRSKPSAAT